MGVHSETADPEALPPAYQDLFAQQAEALKCQQADNESLRGQVEMLGESNRRLEHLVSELQRFIFNKKSENLSVDDGQMFLPMDDLETAISETQEAIESSTAANPPAGKRRTVQRNIGRLPKHLRRIENVIEPDNINCPHPQGQLSIPK